MVTGSLPYTAEANLTDPLYKLIQMKKRDQFWKEWRRYNQREDTTNNNKKIHFEKDNFNTATEEDFEEFYSPELIILNGIKKLLLNVKHVGTLLINKLI